MKCRVRMHALPLIARTEKMSFICKISHVQAKPAKICKREIAFTTTIKTSQEVNYIVPVDRDNVTSIEYMTTKRYN